jgi:Mrp family chromosome partitioning ATPase
VAVVETPSPRVAFGITNAHQRLLAGDADILERLTPRYLRLSEPEIKAGAGLA